MTDTNEALFVVRLPAGEKTVPFEDIPALIAMAKSPGYDREKASEHEAVIFGLAEMNEEGPLEAAVRAGQVEALNNFTLHRIRPPFTGRLKDAVLTVRALREYVESINGCLQVVETTEPQAPPVESDAPWWMLEYDIFDMAKNIGGKLHSLHEPASNAAIAKEIEKRINGEERRKGRDRVAPNHDTIRGRFTGMSFKPD